MKLFGHDFLVGLLGLVANVWALEADCFRVSPCDASLLAIAVPLRPKAEAASQAEAEDLSVVVHLADVAYPTKWLSRYVVCEIAMPCAQVKFICAAAQPLTLEVQLGCESCSHRCSRTPTSFVGRRNDGHSDWQSASSSGQNWGPY